MSVLHDGVRRAELALCAALGEIVTGHAFLPEQGGSETAAEGEQEPPFSVVSLGFSAEPLPDPDTGEATFLCEEARLTVVTHIDEVASAAHSLLVQQIRRALTTLRAQIADDTSYDATQAVRFHGLDVAARPLAVDDDERQSHGDVFHLRVGFTAFPPGGDTVVLDDFGTSVADDADTVVTS